MAIVLRAGALGCTGAKPAGSSLCPLLMSHHWIGWPRTWLEFNFPMPGKPPVPRKPLSGHTEHGDFFQGPPKFR